ncbi:MAG: Hsp20/alpha crystallin family protein [Planctomycetota bacterium]|nr:Hsp20/alpha crystallin family protein [Planctomycetota bacterium]
MTYALQAHKDTKGSIGRHMNRWVNHVLGMNYRKYYPAESWTPAVNLYEGEADYCLVVDLAGVQADKIDLNVENDKMILSGRRETPHTGKAEGNLKLHLMEIDHGRFCRSLELPQDVDIDGIEATYRGGYLWVRMPKKA